MVEKVDLLNKTSFFVKKENIFSNTYVILAILLIGLGFLGYSIYYYMTNKDAITIAASSSYYGTDIANYEPIFKEEIKTVNECITRCQNDITCDGITYNIDTQACLGTKNGQLRSEQSNYNAWVKPPSDKIGQGATTSDFSKSILVGNTKVFTVIDGKKMQSPFTLGYFSYSFNITIYDINKNYGSWRHIFHKGDPIDIGAILNYQSWETLITDFPNQAIGVWLAPFTNNMRIAITTRTQANRNTGSYPDAFVEKCDNLTENCYITDMPGGKWVDKSRLSDNSTTITKFITSVEYIDQDIQNIPINKQINITINFLGKDVEIFFNGKIVKIVRLNGDPQTNRSGLYVMNDKTFGGELSNILYYPDALKLPDIKSIINLAPS